MTEAGRSPPSGPSLDAESPPSPPAPGPCLTRLPLSLDGRRSSSFSMGSRRATDASDTTLAPLPEWLQQYQRRQRSASLAPGARPRRLSHFSAPEVAQVQRAAAPAPERCVAGRLCGTALLVLLAIAAAAVLYGYMISPTGERTLLYGYIISPTGERTLLYSYMVRPTGEITLLYGYMISPTGERTLLYGYVVSPFNPRPAALGYSAERAPLGGGQILPLFNSRTDGRRKTEKKLANENYQQHES